jgi:hypothetical protein
MNSEVPITRDVYKLLEKALREQIEMPRFDYNDVGIEGGVSLDDLAKIIRDYVDAIKIERAAAEAKMDWRFKDLVITAEDLKRIAESAYIYWPTITKFSTKRYVTTEKYKGRTVRRVHYEAKLGVAVQYFRVKFEDAQLEHVVKVSAEHTSDVTKGLFETEEGARKRAILEAVEWVARKINKETRKIKEFKLAAPIQSATFNSVWFPLTKKEGLKLDWGFEVLEFTEKGEEIKVGYVKIREIADGKVEKQSRAQVITSKGLTFEGGELAREYPQLGVSILPRAGIVQTNFKKFDVLGSGGPSTFAPSFNLSVQNNLPQLVNIPVSELYGVINFFLSIPSPFLELTGEAGILKKFWLRRLSVHGALRGGYLRTFIFHEGERYSGDTIGGRASLGLEFFLTPDWSLNAEAGYRFYAPFSSVTNDETGEEVPLGTDYNPSGFTALAGLIFTF